MQKRDPDELKYYRLRSIKMIRFVKDGRAMDGRCRVAGHRVMLTGRLRLQVLMSVERR